MSLSENVSVLKEHSDKYSRMLAAYGYQDIDIKIPIKDSNLLDNLKAFFWMNTYGYSLTISSNNPVSDYDEILALLEDWQALQSCNISGALVDYFEENNFAIRYVFNSPIEGHGRVKAQKDGIIYTVELARNNVEETQVLQDEDDPIEFDEDEIQEFTSKIGLYLRQAFRLTDFTVTASSDLTELNISITQMYTRYFLHVHSHDLDFSWIDYLATKIVYCFWHSRAYDVGYSKFEQHLRLFRFHIVGNICENNVFYVYGEGEKFGITVKEEKLIENIQKQDDQKNLIDFDHMEGHAFEYFCAKVLLANGFEQAKVTQGSGDQGVDIIAYKDGIKYGIQCKCYSSDIGNKAVQEALGGRLYYNCHVGVVLTNRYFTKAAIELAKSTSIVLWNRDKLISMVENLMP